MSLAGFIWSVIAGVLATFFVGATYKIINKNRIKKSINQKGNNNTAFMNSTINMHSDKKHKGE